MGGDGRRRHKASEESKKCMTVCTLGSILTLTMGGVIKMEADEWGRVRILVDTFVRDSRNPYTLYFLAQSSHIDDPLSANLEFSRMVNDNKDVALS